MHEADVPAGRRRKRCRRDKAAKHLLVNLSNNNQLIRGMFELNGRTVDLADIKAPVLDVYVRDDHIIRSKTMQGLCGAVGSDVDSESGLAGSHNGVFVSGKSQDVCGKGFVEQLHPRT
jgi:polyhydroxyalkanoate synthase